MLAPFSGAVMFHHFFIADFVTSLVRALQDTAYSLCFYFTGEFIAADALPTSPHCETSMFAYVLALLPYYWRLMQCVRRYRDDPARQGAQLWNAAKYGAAMLGTRGGRGKVRCACQSTMHHCRLASTEIQLFLNLSIIPISTSRFEIFVH